MKELKIHTEYITLNQAVKLCGEADSGVDAKIMILNGEVKVNHEIEMRRGKKLRENDVFEVKNHEYVVHVD